MLGVIHQAVVGHGPMHFRRFFFLSQCVDRRSARLSKQHSRQLHEYVDGTQLDAVARSALGLARTHNILPAEIVEATSVKRFQQMLQAFARDCAHIRVEGWPYLYSTRHLMHTLCMSGDEPPKCDCPPRFRCERRSCFSVVFSRPVLLF